MSKGILFSGTIIFFWLATVAQEIPDQVNVLRKIQSLQVVEDSFYDPGLFRSQRIKGNHKESYEDNSLFYSALIANALESMRSKVSDSEKASIDSIVSGVKQIAEKYRSRRGRHTYNFWQTDPDIPHPSGPDKLNGERYRLPDDFDDTSVIGMLLSDSLQNLINQEITEYAGSRSDKVKTTFGWFKRSEAYPVWFANKWSQEFDLCVMANVLSFRFQNSVPLDQYDSATIDLIKEAVQTDLHVRKPYLISPFYTRPAVITYHLSRLIEIDRYGFFDSIKIQLIEDIGAIRFDKLSESEKMLLAISQFRMQSSSDIQIDHDLLLEEFKEFTFFSANLFSASGGGMFIRRIFKDSRVVPTLYWYCQAHNMALLYEYLVLKANK